VKFESPAKKWGVRSLKVRCEIGEVGVSAVILGCLIWEGGLLGLVLGGCCFESLLERFRSRVFLFERKVGAFVKRDFWLKRRLV